MKKSQLLILTILVVSAFLLNACSSTSSAATPTETSEQSEESNTTEEQASGEKAKIGFLSISMAPEFTVKMSEGIQNAANEFGYEYIVVDYNSDPEKEISGIETLANSGVKAYYTISLSAEADAEKLKEYPDIGVISQGQFSFYQAAVIDDSNWIAEKFCESLDSFIAENGITGGEIAGIWVDGTQSEDNASHGAYVTIKSVIEDHYKDTGFSYVTDQFPKATEDVPAMTETIMSAYPDVRFFFVFNNDMGIAAAQQIQSAVTDTSGYYVFSTEGSDESFRLIKEGTSPYRACVYADLVSTGYQVGLQLINWVENGTMENVNMQRILVDKTNVSEYYTN